jgi:hypothetical protein
VDEEVEVAGEEAEAARVADMDKVVASSKVNLRTRFDNFPLYRYIIRETATAMVTCCCLRLAERFTCGVE